MRSLMPGSRTTRAMRASALRWSAPASSGASRTNIRSTGWPSSASKSMGLSSRATSPKMLSSFASLACGMATPSPIPVEPLALQEHLVDRPLLQAGEARRHLGELLERLLFAAGAQRRDDGGGREEVEQGHW